MTIEVKPELAAALEALASAHGLSVQDYLEQLVQKEVPNPEPVSDPEGTGMVLEEGLLVYRTGRPLATKVVDETVRRIREDRAKHILGNRS